LNFIYLNLFEKADEKKEKDTSTDDRYKREYPHISSLKEFDLLLLSEEELETKNVKQLTNSKFLMDI
jgi:hypothetical protein